MVNTFGTGRISDEAIVDLVKKHFDLRPKGIIASLDLLRPIYSKTSAYGHFGRDEPEFTWEATDKAAALRSDAGCNPRRGELEFGSCTPTTSSARAGEASCKARRHLSVHAGEPGGIRRRLRERLVSAGGPTAVDRALAAMHRDGFQSPLPPVRSMASP